jgi:hypothetical protein
MNADLNKFFEQERKRVFEPSPFFTEKVMARLTEKGALGASGVSGVSIWEFVPGAMRPVFALALMLLFAVLAVQILVPVEPTRCAIEAAMTSELSPTEVLLFTGAEAPTSATYVQELILEPGR